MFFSANLLKTFTELYFDVRQYDNMKSTDMVRVLVNMALNIDHTEYDSFVCCVLSHGAQGHIYGTDGRLVSITDMTGPFKSVVCPSLAGKPKMFFIQACQGREKQEGRCFVIMNTSLLCILSIPPSPLKTLGKYSVTCIHLVS